MTVWYIFHLFINRCHLIMGGCKCYDNNKECNDRKQPINGRLTNCSFSVNAWENLKGSREWYITQNEDKLKRHTCTTEN